MTRAERLGVLRALHKGVKLAATLSGVDRTVDRKLVPEYLASGRIKATRAFKGPPAARPRPARRRQPMGPVGVPTGRQLEALRFVRIYTLAHRHPPELADIGRFLGLTAHGAQNHLLRLAAKGLLTWYVKVPRSLHIPWAGQRAIASGGVETRGEWVKKGKSK